VPVACTDVTGAVSTASTPARVAARRLLKTNALFIVGSLQHFFFLVQEAYGGETQLRHYARVIGAYRKVKPADTKVAAASSPLSPAFQRVSDERGSDSTARKRLADPNTSTLSTKITG